MSSDDWRLMGQDRYLLGARLKWMTWKPSRLDWDHDHCAFCTDEISDAPIDEHTKHNAAWVTADDEYHWVCPSCFDEFRSRFGWTTSPESHA